MADVDLTGTIDASTTLTGILFASTRTTNTPQVESDNVTQYFGDPPGSTALPASADGAPNGGIQLQPFLRHYLNMTTPGVGNNGNTILNWTYPADVEVGDLVLVVITQMYANTVAPTGWTELWADSTKTSRIWAHSATATDPGTVVTQFVTGYGGLLALGGIWGNAQVDTVLTNASFTSNTATAPQVTIPGGGGGIFGWIPRRGYGASNVYSLQWAPLPYGLTDANLTSSAVATYSWPGMADVFPVHDTVMAPALTSTTANTNFNGDTLNFSVVLKPLLVFPFATVAVEEATGTGGTVDIKQYIHLLAQDIHSPQIPYGYTQGTMNAADTGTAYTYERWIRVRFEPKFNTVARFRFWAANLATLPVGWSVRYGTATNFQTPVNTASSIAINPVPTSDPGSASPNAGGAARLTGTGTQYSDWIVLQASVDTAVVEPGPVLGFSTEGTLIPVQFSFVWIET
jgi:hypothetical protein